MGATGERLRVPAPEGVVVAGAVALPALVDLWHISSAGLGPTLGPKQGLLRGSSGDSRSVVDRPKKWPLNSHFTARSAGGGDRNRTGVPGFAARRPVVSNPCSEALYQARKLADGATWGRTSRSLVVRRGAQRTRATTDRARSHRRLPRRYVLRYLRVELLWSAHRHGVEADDVVHALAHAVAVEEVGQDPLRSLVIGPDRAGNLLEVVVMDRPQGPAVIHAMAMRAKYRRLLPGD